MRGIEKVRDKKKRLNIHFHMKTAIPRPSLSSEISNTNGRNTSNFVTLVTLLGGVV